MEQLTLPLVFVFRVPQKLAPTRTVNIFRQPRSRQSLDAQILGNNALALGHQPVTDLVQKIDACVLDTFMQE